MKAVCWNGITNVGVEEVPEPKLLNPRDAIVKITATAICGSDLHLYDGYIPSMKKGDILGHEFMGEVVEVGGQVKNLAKGDRVVVPFPIACGSCFFCQHDLWALCGNSNPNASLAESICTVTPQPVFLATHICWAAMQVDKQNMSASHLRTWGLSRSKTAFGMNRFSS